MNNLGIAANVTQDRPFEVKIRIGDRVLLVSVLAITFAALVALKKKR